MLVDELHDLVCERGVREAEAGAGGAVAAAHASNAERRRTTSAAPYQPSAVPPGASVSALRLIRYLEQHGQATMRPSPLLAVRRRLTRWPARPAEVASAT